MAGRRETNDLKPIDKAIFGMVSESPGRNASEPISDLEKKKELHRPNPLIRGEGIMSGRKLTDTVVNYGGEAGAAR
jgi:hypothetical protein